MSLLCTRGYGSHVQVALLSLEYTERNITQS